ncbi:hypothetical protein [Parasaccharibacter sp. TMW 2.1888]|uniref:hypothetical protein n=1 Tax=Parasaccharibacter sp. TMW 2.1888 TaxID=2268025 RepID=UPI0020BE04E6|nr:hypothetical protein [Parasaccharibacter sp. TMW 2.1888]
MTLSKNDLKLSNVTPLIFLYVIISAIKPIADKNTNEETIFTISKGDNIILRKEINNTPLTTDSLPTININKNTENNMKNIIKYNNSLLTF